jgi:hypothetical protein
MSEVAKRGDQESWRTSLSLAILLRDGRLMVDMVHVIQKDPNDQDGQDA